MENAVSALKIAFAVFIFMLGLVILFSMASQVRYTAEVLIEGIDKTNYYLYQEDASSETIDNNGNRIVTMDDIVPVLYRYAQENYGVTIVDNSGEIVARFDLDTERACNNWITMSNYSKYKFISETNSIYKKVNQLAERIGARKIELINLITVPANPTSEADNVNITQEKMTGLFEKIYKQSTSDRIQRNYYCGWIGSMEWTAQRIDSDLSRNCSEF